MKILAVRFLITLLSYRLTSTVTIPHTVALEVSGTEIEQINPQYTKSSHYIIISSTAHKVECGDR